MIKVAVTDDIRHELLAMFMEEYDILEVRLVFKRYDAATSNLYEQITVEEYLKSKGYRVRVFTRDAQHGKNSTVRYIVFFDMMDYMRFV